MHFVTAGGGRPALLFVHGFTCDHTDWRFQLRGLEGARQVLACDLRGHGATPGRAQECTIGHYGGDVAALVSHLGLEEVVLVGHSLGCRVVLEAARVHPDPVAGVVLVDGSRTGAFDPRGVDYAAFVEPLVRQMFLRPSPEADAAVARALRLPPELGMGLWASMARWDAERMDEALRELGAPLMAIQSTTLNAERKRAALTAGQSSPWLDLLRERLKDVRIEVVPGVGHFTQLEAGAEVNRLLSEFSSRARRPGTGMRP